MMANGAGLTQLEFYSLCKLLNSFSQYISLTDSL